MFKRKQPFAIDWPLVMRRGAEINCNQILVTTCLCTKYFNLNIIEFCDLVGSFSQYVDICENLEFSQIEFNFDCIPLDKPFLHALKKFVHFYVDLMDSKLTCESKGKEVKEAFFQTKFPLSFPILFNKILKWEQKAVTINDAISAITIGGILILVLEFRKRLR